MLIVANWKAYVESPKKAGALFAVAKKLSAYKGVQIVLAPSFLHLGLLSKENRSKVAFAAQDVSAYSQGAATGEIPATALKAVNTAYVIVGHSERRAFGETDETLLTKTKEVLRNGLTPILCIGEKERDEDGQYLASIRGEIHAIFSQLPQKDRTSIIIAYEPLWAIGKSALQAITPSDLNEMIRYIRKVLQEYMPESAVKKIRILYGGSVEPSNVQELLTVALVDGFLIGRASTDEKMFQGVFASIKQYYAKRP